MKYLGDLPRGLSRAKVLDIRKMRGGISRVMVSVVGVGEVQVPDYAAPDWLAPGLSVQLTVYDPAYVVIGRAVMSRPPLVRWDPLPC